ncbi:MAG: type VI secretion system tip protein TssI/VgrG [Byssovorax sp.]
MRNLTQIKLETGAYPSGELQISRLTGRDTLSQLFEYDLLIIAKDLEDFDPEALIGEPATLVYERDDRPVERVYGMISVVNDRLDTEVDHASCRLVFTPRAYRLALVETLDVFLDLNVPDIVRLKLQGAGMKERLTQPGAPTDHDFELRLQDTYPVREFVVQYKETDLAFVSRLCEHLGITFFFEHGTGRDVMVFCDANEGFSPLAGDGVVPYRGRGDARDVHRLEETIRMIPADYVVRDYNYRTPQVALTGQANVADGLGSVVEYGSHVATPKEAEKLARIRAQEALAARRIFDGSSDLAALRAGSIFTLQGHPRGDLGLLVTEVRQTISQVTLGTGAADAGAFRSEFKAIRKDRRYRPPRATPKPRIHGVVTGVIDSANKGQYADLDDQGRYRVKFLFDTTNPNEGQASQLVRMAQPHAGEGYGMHFPLRPGVEVIITFLDGDPDRPIIAATVPNPQTASPVQAGNAPRNIIRTGGGNEINIDDTADAHRIKLSTPHKNTTFQLGYRNSPEDGAMLETYGSSSSVALAGSNSFGAITNTISLLHEYRSGGSISTIAEKPSLVAKVTAVAEIMSSLVEVGSGVLEATKAGYEARLGVLKLNAIKAQKASQARFEALEAQRKQTKEAGETAKKNTVLLAELTKNGAKPFDEYTEKQEAYESAQRDLMSNEEFLRDALKGEAAGTYAGEIALYKVAVAKSKAALAATKAERDTAREELAKKLQEYADDKNNTKASRDAAQAYLDVLSKTNPDGTGVEAALDKGVNDDWSAWTDDTNPQRQYDLQAEELETGKTGTDLKKASTFFQAFNVAKVLFSDVMAVLALVKALREKFEEIEELAEVDALVKASNPQTKDAATISQTATAAANAKRLIRHTLGSEGNTLVYGKKNLFAWSDRTTLLGKDTLVAVSKTMLWLLSEGKAELAGDEGVFVTSKSGTVSAKSKKFRAVATGGSLRLTSESDVVGITGEKQVTITSKTDNIRLKAEKRVAIESTTDEISLKANAAGKGVFISSAAGPVGVRGAKTVTVESHGGELHLQGKLGATLGAKSGDVLVESRTKKLTLRGKTQVDVVSATNVTITAKKIDLKGIVEVNGALLVKGTGASASPVVLESKLEAALTKLDGELDFLAMAIDASDEAMAAKEAEDIVELEAKIAKLDSKVLGLGAKALGNL